MRFTLVFKTNDVLDQLDETMSEEELALAKTFAERWVYYGEYVRVTFDTNEGTAEVEKQQ